MGTQLRKWVLVPLRPAPNDIPLPLDFTLGAVVIGRSRKCNIVCSQDEAVSARHCEVSACKGVAAAVLEVEDLSSTHGTYLNGKVLGQGLRGRVVHGTVLSLTQPPGGPWGQIDEAYTQFRVCCIPADATDRAPRASAWHRGSHFRAPASLRSASSFPLHLGRSLARFPPEASELPDMPSQDEFEALLQASTVDQASWQDMGARCEKAFNELCAKNRMLQGELAAQVRHSSALARDQAQQQIWKSEAETIYQQGLKQEEDLKARLNASERREAALKETIQDTLSELEAAKSRRELRAEAQKQEEQAGEELRRRLEALIARHQPLQRSLDDLGGDLARQETYLRNMAQALEDMAEACGSRGGHEGQVPQAESALQPGAPEAGQETEGREAMPPPEGPPPKRPRQGL
mmetsp:Transcript_25853/g.56429  ORF Transcript_25853/g.56429 Transcript_25853/m.56429 type:complete len:405 (+) Transcript_25853:37-1251(+)